MTLGPQFDKHKDKIVMKMDGQEVSHVAFEHDENDTTNVIWAASKVPGKGYGTRVVDELYRTFPDRHIDLGWTTESGLPLAEKMYDKYPERTSYEEDL